MKEKTKIELILEKGRGGRIFGRVNYDDDLMTDSASTQEGIEKKMKKLLFYFHDLKEDTIEFSITWEK